MYLFSVFLIQTLNYFSCPDYGFDADEGASLLMAFRGLQAESAAQGEAHRALAKEINTLVADPFEDWARGHRVRAFVRSTSVSH